MGLFGKKNQDKEKQAAPQKPSMLGKMAQGLMKTRNGLTQKLGALFAYYDTIDEDFYQELEAVLISADMGMSAVTFILDHVRAEVKEKKLSDTGEIHRLLRSSIEDIMRTEAQPPQFPLLIFVVGVNGAGKTTAIGKLAYRYAQEGKSVLLAAGDTFRAAAAEQLGIWAERSGAQIVKHGEGADSAAVIFDAVSAAKARKVDVCICDTAGRLQNKKNLMDELAKVGRIIDRNWEGARQTYIVLDATTGQNALSQVQFFNDAVKLDGIILTKLDGTAKGGVAVAIKKEYDLDVKYVGVGEAKEDLLVFDATEYAQNIV